MFIPNPDISIPDPDPEVKKAQDPGSATLVTIEVNVRSEQRIRTGFKADPDPSFLSQYRSGSREPKPCRSGSYPKPSRHNKLNFFKKYNTQVLKGAQA